VKVEEGSLSALHREKGILGGSQEQWGRGPAKSNTFPYQQSWGWEVKKEVCKGGGKMDEKFANTPGKGGISETNSLY